MYVRNGRQFAGLALLALGLSAATACSSEPPGGPTLAALAQESIIPAFTQFQDDADQLQSAVAKLCTEPTPSSLDGVNAAVKDASYSWSFTEAMWVGPVMERESVALVDGPFDPVQIERLLASDAVLGTEELTLGVEDQLLGLGAIEYVVASDGALDAFDERRCDYLVGLTSIVLVEASNVLEAWTTGSNNGPAYSELIADPDSEHLDSLISDSLFLLESIADGELGTALGAMNEAATLDVIEEGPGGFATSDMRGHVAGLRALFIGSGDSSTGISPLLDEEITATLIRQFDTAEAAFAKVGSPLRDEITNSIPVVGAARDGVIELQVTIATQVVAKLGVTIGFSDADGDTG